jgi:hypothetical protein
MRQDGQWTVDVEGKLAGKTDVRVEKQKSKASLVTGRRGP